MKVLRRQGKASPCHYPQSADADSPDGARLFPPLLGRPLRSRLIRSGCRLAERNALPAYACGNARRRVLSLGEDATSAMLSAEPSEPLRSRPSSRLQASLPRHPPRANQDCRQSRLAAPLRAVRTVSGKPATDLPSQSRRLPSTPSILCQRPVRYSLTRRQIIRSDCSFDCIGALFFRHSCLRYHLTFIYNIIVVRLEEKQKVSKGSPAYGVSKGQAAYAVRFAEP